MTHGSDLTAKVPLELSTDFGDWDIMFRAVLERLGVAIEQMDPPPSEKHNLCECLASLDVLRRSASALSPKQLHERNPMDARPGPGPNQSNSLR
jgi:hypothetical protein